jgi:hypothetical protein
MSAEQDAGVPGQSHGYRYYSMGLDQSDPDPQANSSASPVRTTE